MGSCGAQATGVSLPIMVSPRLLAAAGVRVMTVSQLEPHLASASSSRSEVKDEGNVSPLSPYRQLNSFL